MILSFVLFAMFAAVILTYLIPGVGYDLKERHLRSVSEIIVLWREAGHFSVSAGNIVLFALLQKTHPNVAWLVWVAGQGILSFDIDNNVVLHFIFLSVFMGSIVYATVEICKEDTRLWNHIYPLFVSSGLFGLAWVYNMLSGSKKYYNFQNLMELYWILSFIYFFGKYDEIDWERTM